MTKSNRKHVSHARKLRLARRLAAYSLAAGGVMTVAQEASAAIVYTDIADVVLTLDPAPGTPYNLDLNNDSTADFTIDNFLSSGSRFGPIAIVNANNRIRQQDATFAAALAYGTTINSTNLTNNERQIVFSSSGPFVGAGDRYLGLRFRVGGSDFFGWARVEVTDPGTQVITIKDYAFENVANTAILAGDIGAGPGVPEPGTLGLLALGAVGVLAVRRGRKKQANA